MKKFITPLFCFLSIGVALFGQSKPEVLVSIPPYVEFVEEIGGGLFEVKAALPKGADPHHFEISPKDFATLSNAKLWVGIGESFEKTLLFSLHKSNPNLQEINLTTAVPKNLLETSHGSTDLHTWMSPKLAIYQAVAIKDALINLLPNEKDSIQKNFFIFKEKLETLDKSLHALLSPNKHRAIITSHGSFAYFCKEYDLSQITIEEEGKSPLPKNLKQVFQKAKALNAICVITEPQFSSKGAEMVGMQLALPMFCFDPLKEDYINNMQGFGETIAKIAHEPKK